MSAVAIAALWGWLAAAVPMPQACSALGKALSPLLFAVPVRPSPSDPNLQITPDRSTRTGAAGPQDRLRAHRLVELGQDQVASIARRHGLKVIQGMWLE